MIYLVDDDIDDLELAREALERNGFRGEIACARNGEEFMSKLNRSNLPDLIVLDLNMPLKDGFEVLADLKKSKHFSVVPVVILTASHNKKDEKRCIDLGCNRFFRKPATLEELDAIVTSLLDVLRNSKGNKPAIIEVPEK